MRQESCARVCSKFLLQYATYSKSAASTALSVRRRLVPPYYRRTMKDFPPKHKLQEEFAVSFFLLKFSRPNSIRICMTFLRGILPGWQCKLVLYSGCSFTIAPNRQLPFQVHMRNHGRVYLWRHAHKYSLCEITLISVTCVKWGPHVSSGFLKCYIYERITVVFDLAVVTFGVNECDYRMRQMRAVQVQGCLTMNRWETWYVHCRLLLRKSTLWVLMSENGQNSRLCGTG